LDIEVIGAIAPGAQIAVYFAPDSSGQSFIDAFTAAIHDAKTNPGIISISWGGPESKATEQFMQRFDAALQSAARLGITVCVASGDNASADFEGNDPDWDGGAHVDFPASSPFALACGGTELIGRNGLAQNEIVWHSGPNEGTGGGVSRFFPLPDYQKNASIPFVRNPRGRVGRGVPDVSGNAASESGYRILCDGQAFPDPNHKPPIPPIGGTSAVAPLWAGLTALLNQKLGWQLGFINPLLYELAGSGAFQDIMQGNNGDYKAVPGWDPCTGLGSPNGEELLLSLCQRLHEPHPGRRSAR
jgi:kumamolisin